MPKDYETLCTIWNERGVFDKLRDRYEKQIEGMFVWDNIHEELNQKDTDTIINVWEVEKYEETPVYGLYIGSVLNLFPSGKYYMPWSSNVTPIEALRDEVFQEALEMVLDRKGLFAQSGEGDPLDVFFCKAIE